MTPSFHPTQRQSNRLRHRCYQLADHHVAFGHEDHRSRGGHVPNSLGEKVDRHDGVFSHHVRNDVRGWSEKHDDCFREPACGRLPAAGRGCRPVLRPAESRAHGGPWNPLRPRELFAQGGPCGPRCCAQGGPSGPRL